jgi:competence protein ComEC
MKKLLLFCAASVLLSPLCVYPQANGKLQIHFIDVGQGDAILLVSPLGEKVLVDGGPPTAGDRVISYLDQLGLTDIDYQIVSHYHEDHIGCTPKILYHFPLRKRAIDRGGSYATEPYSNYVTCVETKRTSAIKDA